MRIQVFQARRRQSSDARLQVLSAFEPLNLLTQGSLLLLKALDGEVFAPGKHLSLPQFCLLFLKDLFPHFSLRVCILLEKFMVFLKAGQARVVFFGFMLRIISLLLEFIGLLVHLDKQVLHALQISLFDIQSNLQRLTALINTLILRLLESIELSEMAFLGLDLLLAQLLHILRELNNSLLFFSDLLLQTVRLALEHVDLCTVLFSLTDGGNGSGLLFVDHSAQLSCFSLASFFLFFIELL